MEFTKKLKQRFFIAISYILLGLAMVLGYILAESENYFFFSFGIALTLMGVLRLMKHRKIAKNDQTLRKQELAEQDERTRMISERARSWAFSLSIITAGVLVIVLNVLGYREQALPFAWYVCGMVTLYWICWFLIRKKY